MSTEDWAFERAMDGEVSLVMGDEEEGQVIVGWRSGCCRAGMTTAGGDGSEGSTCWAVCRKCGVACDPEAVYAEPNPDKPEQETT